MHVKVHVKVHTKVHVKVQINVHVQVHVMCIELVLYIAGYSSVIIILTKGVQLNMHNILK